MAKFFKNSILFSRYLSASYYLPESEVTVIDSLRTNSIISKYVPLAHVGDFLRRKVQPYSISYKKTKPKDDANMTLAECLTVFSGNNKYYLKGSYKRSALTITYSSIFNAEGKILALLTVNDSNPSSKSSDITYIGRMRTNKFHLFIEKEFIENLKYKSFYNKFYKTLVLPAISEGINVHFTTEEKIDRFCYNNTADTHPIRSLSEYEELTVLSKQILSITNTEVSSAEQAWIDF